MVSSKDKSASQDRSILSRHLIALSVQKCGLTRRTRGRQTENSFFPGVRAPPGFGPRHAGKSPQRPVARGLEKRAVQTHSKNSTVTSTPTETQGRKRSKRVISKLSQRTNKKKKRRNERRKKCPHPEFTEQELKTAIGCLSTKITMRNQGEGFGKSSMRSFRKKAWGALCAPCCSIQ